VSAGDGCPIITFEQLAQFRQLLEFGMCDDRLLVQLFEQVDVNPEALLPQQLPLLGETAFFLWKFGHSGYAKRLLFTCLAWYLQQSPETSDARTIAANLQHMFAKEDHPLTIEQIEQQAREGLFGTATSWLIGGNSSPVTEVSGDGTVSQERTRFTGALTSSLIPARKPLKTFRGWLKRFDPKVLNRTGRISIRNIFPLFGEMTPEQYVSRLRSLVECGVRLFPEDRAALSTTENLLKEGVQVKLRRHRRYAGGDGLLPRYCYSSVSKDAAGDDGGTLSRELLAYIDRQIPGAVFVGDSTDERLNALLGNPVKVLPGYCATYVLLCEPLDSDEKTIFRKVYGELLAEVGGGPDQPIHAFAFETRVDECTVENVIDLRWPEVQQWFFHQFKDGDGLFLRKTGGTVRNFYDLLPTLMHPSLGGTNVTHAIGSWMRSAGVKGLVFPSARSNTSVSISAGVELLDWTGWNFLDYRTASNLPATEITTSKGGWLGFVQPGAQLTVETDDEHRGSWKVIGIQDQYDTFKDAIEELQLGRSSVPGGAAHPDATEEITVNDERRKEWEELSAGTIERGGPAGISRFLVIADFLIVKRDGQGLGEWIEVGFGLLPKSDQTLLLETLIEAYVRKRHEEDDRCD